MKRLDVHFLPHLCPAERIAGGTVVVTDVLRATTTIACALAAGAEAVIPCLTVAEARARVAANPSPVLLGGERGGRPIPGFDLGNSPREYQGPQVAGRIIVFSTTNGTRAVRHCRAARRLLLGAFVNLSSICRSVSTEPAVDIVCAGTDGEISREDVLMAGALAHELARGDTRLNDQAVLAADAWVQSFASGNVPLPQTLRECLGARNLLELGLGEDIELASGIDTLEVVPRYDAAAGWVVAE